MNRRTFLSGLAASGALAQSIGRPPNILFILFDKCRTDAIGAYGEGAGRTPNIDDLAGAGVRFNHCYTPQALCGPARASIITGLHPHAHGVRRNVYPASAGEAGTSNSSYRESIADPFRDNRFRLWDNFPFYLNNAGYATGHIGKWHLGPGNPGFFDYWKSFNSLLRHWIGEPHKSAYRPDVHTDLGIQFINRHASEPFFLYQSYYAPHEPLDPPKQWLEKFAGQEHAGYYGAVANLDWNVGRLVEALKRNGVLDNTLIVLTTEHGRSWGPRPGAVEGMCTAYEESARIPLILRFPKQLPGGKVRQSGMTLVDLAPTILEIAGVQAVSGGVLSPARPLFQGRSLVADMRSDNDRWTRPVVIENIPQAAIDGSFYEERALRNERYKLILRRFDNRPELRPGELYDLQSDPGETKNVYASQPSIVKDLARMLSGWGREFRDELSIELGAWAS